ncbi:MAG: thioredoxin domain-containing protein [Oscillospiraceae bacterium]|nr:thioredoxin domain-containing protein [Oscillospiraceae bacterium]
MSNHLAGTHSPYLLQHQENPVDWYPWCDEAFEKAAREDKPIFLSIGYSTCHWCHVMAHESFEDEMVAELLNRGYVSIKVDREERPDIDAVYMQVCQAMTGSGGWPLTIFMTPDHKPFHAATYLPKYSTYGRAGLLDTLSYLAGVWKKDRARLTRNGEQLAKALSRVAAPKPGTPSKALLEQVFGEYRRAFDPKWGGFGPAPKFPSAHNLLFLMDYADRAAAHEAMDMVCKTLDAMAAGGMFDHIGGGFARYSTDERWLKPHFEKMLYDNALLLLAYTEAYQRTGEARYADTACRTADYVLRELTAPDGGFYSAQDADSAGVEGKYYHFTDDELGEVLGNADADAFRAAYVLTGRIVNRIGMEGKPWSSDDPRLEKLRAYRAARTSLHCDDKILTAWNAWMIVALARAGAALREPRYLEAAKRAEAFLRSSLTDADDRLYLRWHAGACAVPGQLDDYAVYALALLELYRSTFEIDYLQQALHRAEQLQAFFPDEANGGYFRTASDAEKLLQRPKEQFDGAVPSGNSCAAMALQQLAELTGEPKWLAAAEKQHVFVAGRAEAYGTGVAFGLLAMMRAVYPHQELICCGADGREELLLYLERHPTNTPVILLKTRDNAAAMDRLAPFTQSYPVPDSGALWYLCTNGACAMPKDRFSELEL